MSGLRGCLRIQVIREGEAPAEPKPARNATIIQCSGSAGASPSRQTEVCKHALRAPRQRKCTPEERMGRSVALAAAAQHREFGVAQRIGLALSGSHVLEERFHLQSGLAVGDLPQGCGDRLGSGQLKCLPQAGDAFAAAHVAPARFAGAQDAQLAAVQIRVDDFQPRQNDIGFASLLRTRVHRLAHARRYIYLNNQHRPLQSGQQ